MIVRLSESNFASNLASNAANPPFISVRRLSTSLRKSRMSPRSSRISSSTGRSAGRPGRSLGASRSGDRRRVCRRCSWSSLPSIERRSEMRNGGARKVTFAAPDWEISAPPCRKPAPPGECIRSYPRIPRITANSSAGPSSLPVPTHQHPRFRGAPWRRSSTSRGCRRPRHWSRSRPRFRRRCGLVRPSGRSGVRLGRRRVPRSRGGSGKRRRRRWRG
jgi:hypothetical protein